MTLALLACKVISSGSLTEPTATSNDQLESGCDLPTTIYSSNMTRSLNSFALTTCVLLTATALSKSAPTIEETRAGRPTDLEAIRIQGVSARAIRARRHSGASLPSIVSPSSSVNTNYKGSDIESGCRRCFPYAHLAANCIQVTKSCPVKTYDPVDDAASTVRQSGEDNWVDVDVDNRINNIVPDLDELGIDADWVDVEKWVGGSTGGSGRSSPSPGNAGDPGSNSVGLGSGGTMGSGTNAGQHSSPSNSGFTGQNGATGTIGGDWPGGDPNFERANGWDPEPHWEKFNYDWRPLDDWKWLENEEDVQKWTDELINPYGDQKEDVYCTGFNYFHDRHVRDVDRCGMGDRSVVMTRGVAIILQNILTEMAPGEFKIDQMEFRSEAGAMNGPNRQPTAVTVLVRSSHLGRVEALRRAEQKLRRSMDGNLVIFENFSLVKSISGKTWIVVFPFTEKYAAELQ